MRIYYWIFLIPFLILGCSSAEKKRLAKRLAERRSACRKADTEITMRGDRFPRFNVIGSVGYSFSKQTAGDSCLEGKRAHKDHPKYCHSLGQMYERLKYEKCASYWYSYGCKDNDFESCEALKRILRGVASNFQKRGADNNTQLHIHKKYHSLAAKTHNCLPKNKKNLLKNKKYKVVTVSGDTYELARKKLLETMPQAGFLKHIKQTEIKKLTNRSYTEKKTIKTNMSANIDFWLKYECKHQGEFYVTALIPKEGIKYLDIEYPAKMTVGYIKQVCKGYKKIFIIVADVPYDFTAARNRLLKDPNGYWWRIMCGNVKVHTECPWNHYNYDNTFDNFKAMKLYGMGSDPRVRHKDISIDLWMELTKDF